MSFTSFPCTFRARPAHLQGQSRPDHSPQKSPLKNEDKMRPFTSLTAALLIGFSSLTTAAHAEITIDINSPVIEPMPFAVPDFIDEGGAGDYARDISRVVAADLAGTGLFIETPKDAYISRVTSFDAPISYPDWQAINTQALITGAVQAGGDGAGERTVISARCLEEGERAPELARMMGAREDQEQALRHAQAILAEATAQKQASG